MASGRFAGLRAFWRGVRNSKPPSWALALAASQALTTGTLANSTSRLAPAAASARILLVENRPSSHLPSMFWRVDSAIMIRLRAAYVSASIALFQAAL